MRWAAAVLLASLACAPGERTVVLTVRHSRFEPSRVVVARGTAVRFVVRNTDPIDHELIVGDAEVQDRHEHGTERHHDEPGSVSVAAGAEAVTSTVVAGDTLYGCHLPGHWAYGMRGEIVVG